MEGVINVLKPPGMTSHDVISYLRRVFKMKKIGHAGTLDPQAAGVLPVCLGRATRLLEYLYTGEKDYFCEIMFGISTTTQDAWGEVQEIKDAYHLTRQNIVDVIPGFLGSILQNTPAYSAVKVGGIPLYKKARQGQETEIIPRKVFIRKIDIIKVTIPSVYLHVTCSKGTYIRTLCHDMGKALGVGGHMSFLLRTRVGSFNINDSFTLQEISDRKEECVFPIESCLQDLNKIVLSDDSIEKLNHGQIISLSDLAENSCVEKDIAVLDNNNRLHAIASLLYSSSGVFLKPKKVFN